MISNINEALTSAVFPDGSSGGKISTTSPPTRLQPLNPRSMRWASWVVYPPTSGVPVPGA